MLTGHKDKILDPVSPWHRARGFNHILSENQRRVLMARFGLDNDGKKRTLEATGQALTPPMSKQIVSQHSQKGFARLRNSLMSWWHPSLSRREYHPNDIQRKRLISCCANCAQVRAMLVSEIMQSQYKIWDSFNKEPRLDDCRCCGVLQCTDPKKMLTRFITGQPR